MSYITTYTRKHFDPVHPEAELIDVWDIAHALPMICRGNGHVSSFWSVGEHCICCAKEALGRGYSRRLALACLLHDASECYMSDVPRPLKQEMPRYNEVEKNLLQVIYEKYLGSALTDEEERLLKQIDDDLLWYDLEILLEEKQPGEAPKLHFQLDYTVRSFAEVEQEYLDLFEKLREENKQYKVTAIQEDIDFGCEERSADSPVMAVVVLQGEDGSEKVTRQVDQLLYDREINEGDFVYFDERNELKKHK